jgi:hypothetical protein
MQCMEMGVFEHEVEDLLLDYCSCGYMSSFRFGFTGRTSIYPRLFRAPPTADSRRLEKRVICSKPYLSCFNARAPRRALLWISMTNLRNFPTYGEYTLSC